MKKKGFTLSEVLVTLGIIGVVAALTLPGIIGNMPCQNKIKALKAYSALTGTIEDLVSDPSLYYGNNCNGLDCRGQNLDGNNYGIVAGTGVLEKFARLAASKMNKSTDIAGSNAAGWTFTTTDGTTWTIASVGAANTFPFRITIDVNNDANDAENNTNTTQRTWNNAGYVDQFQFRIDQFGGVTPEGTFEKQILATSANLSKSEFKADMENPERATKWSKMHN